MKTVVILGITLLAGVGVIALSMPGPHAFADLRNLTLPAAWKAPERNQVAAQAAPTQAAVQGVPGPVAVARLAQVEPVAHEEAARLQGLIQNARHDSDSAAESEIFARELQRTRAFSRLARAEDVRLAAFDTRYFKGSAVSGCAKACEAAAPCVVPSSVPKLTRSAAALRQMEAERETLEQIRETIEDDHADGRLSLDHYKRLMTRYSCGIRTYQAQITNDLSVADAD